MRSWDVAYRLTEYILVTIRITVRIQEFVPDSEIRIHWIIEEVTNGFWRDFTESWGVA